MNSSSEGFLLSRVASAHCVCESCNCWCELHVPSLSLTRRHLLSCATSFLLGILYSPCTKPLSFGTLTLPLTTPSLCVLYTLSVPVPCHTIPFHVLIPPHFVPIYIIIYRHSSSITNTFCSLTGT